jgi:hypothetical protein
MKTELENLENVAKETVSELVKTKELLPTLMMETPDGFDVMGIVMESKEDIIATIKTLLRTNKATAYALVIEGYATKSEDAANRVQGRIRDLPPDDRFDVASVTLVEKGKTPKLISSVIDSDKDGIRSLRGWETSQSATGRFIIENW